MIASTGMDASSRPIKKCLYESSDFSKMLLTWVWIDSPPKRQANVIQRSEKFRLAMIWTAFVSSKIELKKTESMERILRKVVMSP